MLELDFVLFGLRILSVLTLLGMLGGLFMLVWREMSSTSSNEIPRIQGYLAVLAEVDGSLIETGAQHPLQPITSIGRAPTNSIVISDDFASSEHAAIVLRNGQWWLEDHRSRNGTQLNGERVEAPTIITHGDCIGIGQVTLKLVLKTQ